MKRSVYILYHFFYPDDVVSAEQKKELALGLVERGWDVTVLTSNRFCFERDKEILERDVGWRGLRIIRAPRPAHNQSSFIGRLRNSYAIQRQWLRELKALEQPTAVIIGTDPQFSQFLFRPLRKLMPETKLILWSFDVYPEILEQVDSRIISGGAKLLRPLMRHLYEPVDLLADIGPCMRKRLNNYASSARRTTLVPWALVEPDRPDTNTEVRRELFGDAKLGVLYSGTIGRAHVFEKFVALARRLRRQQLSVAFCFAGRGNRYAELHAMIGPDDTNIRFSDFCPLNELQQRLGAADMHMISLRSGWEGTVVPSKFFGALAAGKPVIYDGASDSDIGIWVRKFDLGIVLEDTGLDAAVQRLRNVVTGKRNLIEWQRNAYETYHAEFSRQTTLDKWDETIRGIL